MGECASSMFKNSLPFGPVNSGTTTRRYTHTQAERHIHTQPSCAHNAHKPHREAHLRKMKKKPTKAEAMRTGNLCRCCVVRRPTGTTHHLVTSIFKKVKRKKGGVNTDMHSHTVPHLVLLRRLKFLRSSTEIWDRGHLDLAIQRRRTHASSPLLFLSLSETQPPVCAGGSISVATIAVRALFD